MILSIKKLGLLSLIVLFITIQGKSQSGIQYKVGQKVEDFSMFDFNSKKYSSKNVKDKEYIVLLFIRNNCTYTNNLLSNSIVMHEKYNSRVEFWAVNSYNPNFYPEESEVLMKEYSTKNNLPYPYLVDLGQEVAGMFNIRQTPYAVILKKEGESMRLMYKGIIFDTSKSTVVNYLEKNLNNLFNNKAVVNSTSSGKLCAIDY